RRASAGDRHSHPRSGGGGVGADRRCAGDPRGRAAPGAVHAHGLPAAPQRHDRPPCRRRRAPRALRARRAVPGDGHGLTSPTPAAQTDSIPPRTLDSHVTIGGRYFDVLAGEYTIEPRSDGSVVLHLASELRVTTHFNFYSRLWVDSIMRSIQENILEVVRAR